MGLGPKLRNKYYNIINAQKTVLFSCIINVDMHRIFTLYLPKFIHCGFVALPPNPQWPRRAPPTHLGRNSDSIYYKVLPGTVDTVLALQMDLLCRNKNKS